MGGKGPRRAPEAGCTRLVLHSKKDRHTKSLTKGMGLCPGLHRGMRAIASVDSSDQGGNKVVRPPAQIASLLHHGSKSHRDVPAKFGGMRTLAPGLQRSWPYTT